MAEKRRGVLALVAGAGVMAIRGADEAASLLARGSDELIHGAGKSGDETASKADELVAGAKRAYRRKRIEDLLRDETVVDSFSLPSGYYGGFRIDPGHRARLDYAFETESGRPIDCFLFDEREFRTYRNGLDVDRGLAIRSRSDEGTVPLERDVEYALVFDHTDAAMPASSDATVTVETTVSLAVL